MRARLEAATNDREHFEAGRAWQRQLFDGGWAGISWPAEYGGRGATPAQATIFAEEQARFARERRLRRVDDRHGRPGAPAPRQRSATGAVPAAAAARRRDVVPAVQRAVGRERPREPRDARRSATATSSSSTGRRCGRRTRTCATSRSCSRARIPTCRSTAGSRSFSSICARPASRSARCARSPAPRTSTRCSSPTCAFRSRTSSARSTAAGRRRDAVLAHEASVIGGGNAAALGYAALARPRARARPRGDDPIVRQRLAHAYHARADPAVHEAPRAARRCAAAVGPRSTVR